MSGFHAVKIKTKRAEKKIILITIPLHAPYRFVGGIKSPFYSAVWCSKNLLKEEDVWAAVRNLWLLGISFVKQSFQSATAIKKIWWKFSWAKCWRHQLPTFITTIFMPVFQMTAKSIRHQSCRTQFVSVQVYWSQLLCNDSNAITKMEMYEMYFQGRGNFRFASSRLHELQGSPQPSPKAAHLWPKLYLFFGMQTH